MTAPVPVERSSDATARSVVRALADESLVRPEDRLRAVHIVAEALEGRSVEPLPTAEQHPRDPLRRRLTEVLAYVGAGLVVSAVLLFVGTRWQDMGFGARLALLVVAGVVLGVAGLAVVAGSDWTAGVRRPEHETRRRLASVLLTGTGATAAGIVGVVLDHVSRTETSAAWALPFTALAAVTVAGYLLSPSVVGQLGAAVGVVGAAGVLMSTLRLEDEAVASGLMFVTIGVLWAVVAEVGWWREETVARSLGSVLAFFGTQQLFLSGSSPTLGYALSFLLAVAGFVLYLFRRAWPYLVLGVVALTASVTEAAADWFQDSIGVAGMLLVAGMTLLVAALVAMRLRREAHVPRA